MKITNNIRKLVIVVLCFFVMNCNEKTKNQYFDRIAKNDVLLSEPNPGEWRYYREEKLQTVELYQKKKKITPSESCKTIYIKPIGEFDSLQRIEIDLMKKYLTIFFQLNVKIEKILPNTIISDSKKRTLSDGNQQILAGYILDSLLKPYKKKDAIVTMAITEKDLYPKPEWNFVFGLASYFDGVGVTSMYRFNDKKLTQNNFKKSLTRLLKTSSHEIGHMFGLSHCVYANCVMNGSNSLVETDSRTLRLCSLCQEKLHSNISYDNEKRLNELLHFLQENNLDEEYKILYKDKK